MPGTNPTALGTSDYSTLKFFQPPVSQGQAAGPVFEEDSEWWVSIQQCGATIALAAALAIGALSSAQAAQVSNYHQDEIAQAPADEAHHQQQTTLSREWSVPAPYSFDAGEIVPQPVAFLPDEDFYQPAPTAPLDIEFQQPWFYGDQEPAGNLSAPPDESFWQNPVAPVVSIFQYPQPWSFDQPEQFFFPDEDLWVNPVAPLAGRFDYPQPYSFDQSETLPQPAAPIQNEDFAFVPQQTVFAYWMAPAFTDDDLALPQQAPYDDSTCLMPIIQWPDYIVTLY